jgi:hypothetical protein
MASLLIASLLLAPATLADLETRFKALPQGHTQQALQAGLAFNSQVAEFVQTGKLETADELWRAAKIYSDPFNNYENSRVRYELGLAAAIKGGKEAREQLPQLWNMLQMSLGRPQRLEGAHMMDSPRFRMEAAPACIQKVHSGSAPSSSGDNAELKAIVDADQKARQADWSKLTQDDMHKIAEEDEKRLARVLELVAANVPATANDFFAAALVMQHGSFYDHYRLAHELAVAGALLGHSTSKWLAAASYDRMLGSCGHRQRYGTQYGMGGIQPYDTAGIGDSVRAAMGCPTLEKAINRKL